MWHVARELLCATVLLVTADRASAAEVPRVVCEDPVYDFGAVSDTQTVSHVFTIRNTGTGMATLPRVFACCGLTAEISSTNISPGSNAVLRVTLTAAGMRGTIEKPVDVVSNDPKERYCRVLFKGVVTPTLLVEPRYVSFNVQRGDTPASAEVLVASSDGVPLRVTNVTASAGFSASFTPDTGGVFRVQVRTVPPLTNGWHRGAATVFSDHPARRQILVPLSVHVADEWIVQPPEIVLTDASMRTTNLTRWIVVSSRFGKAFEIGAVETPDSRMTVTRQALRTNVVRMAIAGIEARPELNGKAIGIHLRGEREVRLTVPFRMVE